jgi:fermentation-respiration switch protein FrsA (DUF1100 family)
VHKIRAISVPKLVFHSPEDEIIPFGLAEKLFAAASGPKKFVAIRGDHNNCFFESYEVMEKEIGEFLKTYAHP